MNNKPITLSDLFLAVLALLLISVSFYQTWVGLQQIFGQASFIIALVLSLLLLFLCWMLRAAKLEGRSTSGLVWIYIFIASFCFISNFNALYTRFMRTDIYVQELKDINEGFNKLETDVESKLSYKIANKGTRQNVEIKKNQLIEQIKDPKDPGIGIKAMSLIQDIQRMTGEKIDLYASGKDYEGLAERMGQQIDAMLNALPPSEKDLESKINKAVSHWNEKMQDFLSLSKKDQDAIAQVLIDQSLTEYNKLGNKAQSILGVDKLKFEPMLSKTQDVGKIGYAFEHAIKNFGMYQFVVLAGCILLDFIIVIIILLVTNPTSGNTSRSVFTSKRTGTTLLPK